MYPVVDASQQFEDRYDNPEWTAPENIIIWGCNIVHSNPLALALAMLDVNIKEDLFDHDFVERWTYGFDELAAVAANMPPEKAAEVCWISTEKIRRAARLHAKARPARSS